MEDVELTTKVTRITTYLLTCFSLVGLSNVFPSVDLGYIISSVDDKMCNH